MIPAIAMLGCGFIGAAHAMSLHGLLQHGAVPGRLVVACDTDGSRAQDFQGRFGFAESTTDPDYAIHHPDVNTVYVCTPTVEHAAVVEKVAARGHAVFCEKPLAHTADQAQAMDNAVRRAGVPAQTGLVLRYSPVYVELRRLLLEDSAATGRPMAVVFRDDQCFPIRGKYKSSWRGDVAIAGGGALIEHSIHDIDLLRWYFGDIKTVWAQTSYFAGQRGVEDVTAAMLAFKSGVTATLMSVWHQMDARQSDRLLEIFCERVYLRGLHDFVGPIEIQRNDEEAVTVPPEDVLSRYRVGQGIPDGAPEELANAYVQENLAFLRALVDGRTPWPGLEEAVAAHRVVDAIYRSARTGQPVSLEAGEVF